MANGAGELSPDRGGDLDVRAVGRALARRKRWIIGPTLLVAVLAALIVNVMTPRYKSEARILYDGRENVFLRPQAERTVTERLSADQEAVASQVQLVLSRELALQVIDELKLNLRPEFDPMIDGLSLFKRLLVFIGASRDPQRMSAEERVLDSYYERLTAYAVDKSRVITVEFQSFDPVLAARVVNAIAEGYLGLQQRAKQEEMRASSQWLSGEIEVLRRKVAEAEARAEEFRSRSNLFVGTNNTTLSNQQLGEFNTQLGSARAQKSDAETRARLIRDMLRKGEAIEASEIVNSELVRRLSEQRVALKAQLAEQYSTLLDAHPRIKELKAQIADLDRQIRAEAEKLVRTLENDAKIAGARVEALSANLDALKRQAATTNEEDVRLRALEREARAQRELLESYLARFREASARENIASGPADARIISRGIVSNTPYFPKKLPIVLIATLSTLVISAGFVTTGALLRGAEADFAPVPSPAPPAPAPQPRERRRAVRRFAAPGAAERAAAPELASDPPSDLAADMAADLASAASPTLAPALSGPEPADQPAERAPSGPVASVDGLVEVLRADGPGRATAFFGEAADANRSLAALAVARALAREALVVLVRLAADAPDLPALPIDPNAPGVADMLAGTASFGEIITRDRLSRAHVVPHGLVAADPAEILDSLRFVTMIDALARTYDYVIVDAGAVGEVALDKALAIAPRGVLVAGDADKAGASAARARLDAAGYRNLLVFAETPAEALSLRTAAE